MKRTILGAFTALLAIILSAVQTVSAQTPLVKNGKPVARVVVGTDNPDDRTAADLLQDFVGRISGAELQIVDSSAPYKKGDVAISSFGANPVYGVVSALEKLGVRYWAADAVTVPQSKDVALEIAPAETPSFSYRQIPSWSAKVDPLYKLWHRVQVPADVFAGGYWVHTFNRLMPASRYGAAHPEYYSYYNGARHPGSAGQWCLTNPAVLEIAAAQLDSIFKANPGKDIISVSQNDGNFTNCQCDNCRRVDSLEGAPSGSLIHFMNALAARFPDKQISTLAYLYSMRPPAHVKPLPNVNIMLCSIDADREVPLTDNASGREFVAALNGWADISNNIFVWDYAINFDNYLSPFPNFHVLKPNMQLFRDNHASMQHCQMSGQKGTNFEELRTYMAAKLAWNVDADDDALMREFLDGFYGPAGTYLYRYIKVMEGALLGSGERLWIYDSPVTFKGGVLAPAVLRKYNELFDAAEKAVASDPVLLARVREERLTLQYSTLELMRADPGSDPVEMVSLLDVFEKSARELDVRALNEGNNTVADYCALYRQRYIPRPVHSLAAGAPVTFPAGQEPTGKYADLAKTALTDELFGGSSFVESWVGWEGKDGAMVVDLGSKKQFSQVSADFLHQLGQWILFPRQVTYSVSDDNRKFTPLGVVDIPEDRSPQVKFLSATIDSPSGEPWSGRYLKVEVKGVLTCPEWHFGVGYPCWFFIDEISVY